MGLGEPEYPSKYYWWERLWDFFVWGGIGRIFGFVLIIGVLISWIFYRPEWWPAEWWFGLGVVVVFIGLVLMAVCDGSVGGSSMG